MTLEFHCTAASPSCVHFELPVMQPGHSPTDHPLFAGSVYQRAHFHPAKPKELLMATTTVQAGYEGDYVQRFQFFLQHSGEHTVMREFMDKVLPGEFARIGEGKSDLNFLGVGSGQGEMDSHMLNILQSKFPTTQIDAHIVEPSIALIENFKASVAKSPNLQKVPFAWNAVSCAEYEKQVKDTKDTKRFDFMNMIQMLYYMDDYAAAIKFFHSLLREKGRLMIIHEAAGSSWATLWSTFAKDLCTKSVTKYISAADVKGKLDKLGLKYEEHSIPNTMDITECFVEGSKLGAMLLDFMTDQDSFQKAYSPEMRAKILDLLRDKCSTEKNGRRLFDCSLTCFLIQA
ncbi:histamine N-methyltransferase-like [Clupea harengus]|uniref:Histamine N-methyltransferase-like n=1 Tax=Clupea harengus TaxID=7950 RepID=A0A6P3VZR2_CLUHA|nr:histamine N-methyltransferase-like [Clupea harengus]